MTIVREFHEAFDQPRPKRPPLRPDPDLIRFRMRLIDEEFKEVMADLSKLAHHQSVMTVDDNMALYRALLKELADLRYVLEGCAVSLGLPIDAAYEMVHESNMSKLGEDGLPIRDAGGKVLKGPNYHEPDLTGLVPDIIDI